MLALEIQNDLGNLTLWLLIVHVLSAILLLGPSGAFSVMGPRAASPETGGHKMLEAILEVQKKFVYPGIAVQFVTGIWLLVRLDLDRDFFANGWLWVSILLFLILVGLSMAVDTPAIRRIVTAANAGQAPDPKDISLSSKLGPFFGALFAIIAFLMVAKPF